METTFLPTGEGGLIVRWVHAECEQDVIRAVQSVPEDVWEATPLEIHVGSAGLLLFDSAFPGDDLPSTGIGTNVPWLELAIPRGRYEINTADYEPDDHTRLILHRLRHDRSRIG
jgi:hypothetical protein